MYIKCVFIIISIILTIMLLFYKLSIQKQKRTQRTANYISILAGFLAAYIIFGILLSICAAGIINKIILMLIALSPFFIGKFATYKYEYLYSYFQILCVIISIGYVYLI